MILLSADDAIKKAQKYCAYQERSQQEVRDKLYTFGLHKQQVEQIIAQLVTDNFINEERFAIAFTGGKFRIKKWGRVKIRVALQAKKVSPYCIKKSLEQIPLFDYINVIRKLIAEQEKKSKEKNISKRNYQVAQYLIGRGFEQELVWNEINEALT